MIDEGTRRAAVDHLKGEASVRSSLSFGSQATGLALTVRKGIVGRVLVAISALPALIFMPHAACQKKAPPALRTMSAAIDPTMPPVPVVSPKRSLAIGQVQNVAPSPAPSPPIAVDGGAACGSDTSPPCPLQGWMKLVITPALAARDAQALTDAFLLLAKHPPPEMAHWSSVAKDGATAAHLGDFSAAQGSCRGCHHLYLEAYKHNARMRPVFAD